MGAARACAYQFGMIEQHAPEALDVARDNPVDSGLELGDVAVSLLQRVDVARQLGPAGEALEPSEDELRVGERGLRRRDLAEFSLAGPVRRKFVRLTAYAARAVRIVLVGSGQLVEPCHPGGCPGFDSFSLTGLYGGEELFGERPVLIDVRMWGSGSASVLCMTNSFQGAPVCPLARAERSS